MGASSNGARGANGAHGVNVGAAGACGETWFAPQRLAVRSRLEELADNPGQNSLYIFVRFCKRPSNVGRRQRRCAEIKKVVGLAHVGVNIGEAFSKNNQKCMISFVRGGRTRRVVSKTSHK